MPRVEIVCIARIDGHTIMQRKESRRFSSDFDMYEQRIPWITGTLNLMSVETCHAVGHCAMGGGETMAKEATAFCEACGDEFDVGELNEEGLCKECEEVANEEAAGQGTEEE